MVLTFPFLSLQGVAGCASGKYNFPSGIVWVGNHGRLQTGELLRRGKEGCLCCYLSSI